MNYRTTTLAALALSVVLAVYLIRADSSVDADSSVAQSDAEAVERLKMHSKPTFPRQLGDQTGTSSFIPGDETSASQGTDPDNPTAKVRRGPMTVVSSDGGVADKEETLATLKKIVGNEMERRYGLLIDDLEMSKEKKQALLDLLIEVSVANTKTNYNTGNSVTEEERSKRIADVIGQEGLTSFLDLEKRKAAYFEVQKFQSMFESNNQPLSVEQRHGLLDIIEEARNVVRQEVTSATGSSPSGRADLHRMKWGEYHRHLMELAPSVLSKQQVVLLDRRLSNQRHAIDSAIEQYETKIANGADPEKTRLVLPIDYLLPDGMFQ